MNEKACCITNKVYGGTFHRLDCESRPKGETSEPFLAFLRDLGDACIEAKRAERLKVV